MTSKKGKQKIKIMALLKYLFAIVEAEKTGTNKNTGNTLKNIAAIAVRNSKKITIKFPTQSIRFHYKTS